MKCVKDYVKCILSLSNSSPAEGHLCGTEGEHKEKKKEGKVSTGNPADEMLSS